MGSTALRGQDLKKKNKKKISRSFSFFFIGTTGIKNSK